MAAMAGLIGFRGAPHLQHWCNASIAALNGYGSPVCNRRLFDDCALAFSPHSPGAENDQPFVDDDRWLMVADVRLDNRRELQARLGLSDDRVRSDAEILFRCWRRLGDCYLDSVVGDYAVATYDQRDRRLTLTRDPTGQRPIYYARRKDGIAFASMPSGLHPLIAESRPNLEQLASDLVLIPYESERTVFSGIERVRPGESVTFDETGLHRTTWQPEIVPDLRSSDKQLIEEFRSLLDQAVRARLPVGHAATHLSAGWDSNAVTATAARLMADPSRLCAFTAAPPDGPLGVLPRGRYGDEAAIAAAAARDYGIQHRVVRNNPPIIEVIRRHSRLCQMPILSPFNVAWWSEIRVLAKEQGAEVILTGELGNLTLNSGGLAQLGDLLRLGEWRQWWHEASAAGRRSNVHWRGVLFNSFGHHLPSHVRDMLVRQFQHVVEGQAALFLQPHWREQVAARAAERYRPSGNSYRDRWRKMRSDDIGPWRLAAIADRGIEERDPTSDRRLIEFSMRLPPGALLRDGQPRPVARAALSDRVPAIVLDAQQRGLQSADWHLRLSQREAFEILDEIDANSVVHELIDLVAVRGAIERWPTGDWNKGRDRILYSMDLPAVLATGIFITEFTRSASADSSPRI